MSAILSRSQQGFLFGALFAAAAFIVLVLTQEAQAQAATPAPDATSASYGAWTLNCLTEADNRSKCEISQPLTLQGKGELQGKSAVIGHIALGYKEAEGPMVLALRLPLGVYLPANVELVEASGQKASAQYRICTQFCIADASPSAELIAALKKPDASAQLHLQDAGRNPIEISLDLNGFAAVIEALEAK